MHDPHDDPTATDVALPDEKIELACRSLKAIAHPLRLRILCALEKHEMTVQEIVAHVGAHQSNVSQHLNIMREKGLLHSGRDSNRVFYRVVESRSELLHACSSLH